MDDQFFALLTADDPAVRQQAGTALDSREWQAVLQALVRTLRDERFSYAWPNCYELLPEIVEAPFSFEYFVDDLAGTPNDAVFGRLAAALGLAAGTRPPRFTGGRAALGGAILPEPTVPADELEQVAALVALLASPREWTRQRAVRSLAQHGRGVVGVLRAVRASRMPGHRAALSALAEIDWTELAPADRALVERLIRVKQHTEVPAPFVPQAEWYALPTTDQAAVLAAFDLQDPVPVTLRMGFAPWQRGGWEALPWYTGYGSTAVREQVFVTPALDGWTLVFVDGETLAADGKVPKEDVAYAGAHRRCAELSRRFGTAHWYLESEGGGCWDQSGWCVAEAGEIVRYSFHDDYVEGGVQTGPGHPTLEELRAWLEERAPGTAPPPEDAAARRARKQAEKELQDELLRQIFGEDWPGPREPDDDDEEEEDDDTPRRWELTALAVASRLSVSPNALGPHTTVQGTGVLAIPAGKPDSRRYGALPV